MLQYTKVTNVDACVLMFAARDGAAQWEDALARKVVSFQPESSQSCLIAISELSCKKLGSHLVKPAAIKGCETVISGSVADEASCSGHLECKSSDASCYGSCVTPRPLQCGEELCGAAEFCDTEKNVCSTLKAVGEKCANFSECEDDCVEGMCKAAPPVLNPGSVCGEGHGYICSLGEFCAADKCTSYLKKGESCSSDRSEFKTCEAPFECRDDICS